jgi:glycerol-3-phosphate dehydrogenase
MTRRDKRVFFAIPWYGKTLLGTTDADYHGDLNDVRADDADIDYLLEEANAVIDEPHWDRSMIEGAFAGVRALKYESGKSPSTVTREWVLESPVDRLLVSIGGKYTSARADAAVIVDRVVSLLKKPRRRSPTLTRPFPWSPPESFAIWKEKACRDGVATGLDPETVESSVYRYGNEVEVIHRLIRARADLAERIHPQLPFCRAEVVYGAQEGMALTLEDLLRRRTPILILAPVDRRVLEMVADLVSPILGWDDNRCDGEIAEVLDKWGR